MLDFDRNPDRDYFNEIMKKAFQLGEITLREKVNQLELTLEDLHNHVQYGLNMPEITDKARLLFRDRSYHQTPVTNKRRLIRLKKSDLEEYLTNKYPTGITFCVLHVILGPLKYQKNPKTKPNDFHDKIVRTMLEAWSQKQKITESEILYHLVCDSVSVNDHIFHVIKEYPEEIGLISKAIQKGDITFPSLPKLSSGIAE